MEITNDSGPNIGTTLAGVERSIRSKNAGEIRKILGNAEETFRQKGMHQYSRESHGLAQQAHWQAHDMMLAHSFVLYHMYLMFYGKTSTDECSEFLNRILELYKQGKTPAQ